MNRALLAGIIGDDFNVVEAENGFQAVAQMRALGSAISLVLLDIVMPGMDGFDVLAVMNRYDWIRDIPVIMVSSETASSCVERAYELGVTDFISRPFDAHIIKRRVTNTLMLYAKQRALVGMVADQIYEREKATNLMVSILSHVVEFRNGESGLHVLHVSSMTDLLLNQVMRKTDRYGLTQGDASLIAIASSLHDIGKISIPDEVLNKPGRLTDEEFAQMKQHTVIGAQMLDDLHLYRNEPLVKTARDICRWHHERYDGKGYPDGLVGDETPIAAQVVALADVYDALTSERVYKEAYPHERAMEMIFAGECGAFNPFLLECLTDVADEIRNQLCIESPPTLRNREIRKVVDEVVRPDVLHLGEHTMDVMDYERKKCHFFASMSDEIQYEYIANPSMVMVSDWGNHELGLDPVIGEPRDNPDVQAMLGKGNIERIERALHSTTPEDPVVQLDLEVAVKGLPRWFHLTACAIWSDDEPAVYHGSIGKLVDIHERHERLRELEYKAGHDDLTGLMNAAQGRRAIVDRMAAHPDGTFVFMVIDLDHFKDANDTRGHLFGDSVLRHFARRLRASVRDGDVVARVGGDEFLVCMECPIQVGPLVERVHRSITGEYEGFPISVSMGVVRARGSACDYNGMFRAADAALYEKKNAGRGGYLFGTFAPREGIDVQ